MKKFICFAMTASFLWTACGDQKEDPAPKKNQVEQPKPVPQPETKKNNPAPLEQKPEAAVQQNAAQVDPEVAKAQAEDQRILKIFRAVGPFLGGWIKNGRSAAIHAHPDGRVLITSEKTETTEVKVDINEQGVVTSMYVPAWDYYFTLEAGGKILVFRSSNRPADEWRR